MSWHYQFARSKYKQDDDYITVHEIYEENDSDAVGYTDPLNDNLYFETDANIQKELLERVAMLIADYIKRGIIDEKDLGKRVPVSGDFTRISISDALPSGLKYTFILEKETDYQE